MFASINENAISPYYGTARQVWLNHHLRAVTRHGVGFVLAENGMNICEDSRFTLLIA